MFQHQWSWCRWCPISCQAFNSVVGDASSADAIGSQEPCSWSGAQVKVQERKTTEDGTCVRCNLMRRCIIYLIVCHFGNNNWAICHGTVTKGVRWPDCPPIQCVQGALRILRTLNQPAPLSCQRDNGTHKLFTHVFVHYVYWTYVDERWTFRKKHIRERHE